MKKRKRSSHRVRNLCSSSLIFPHVIVGGRRSFFNDFSSSTLSCRIVENQSAVKDWSE